MFKSPWFLIILAGIFEVAWAIGLKYTHGFTRWLPSLITAIFLILSMYLLSLGAKHLPISTAYPVWVGIGAIGASILGFTLLGEPFTWIRGLCLVMIVGGVIGLKIC